MYWKNEVWLEASAGWGNAVERHKNEKLDRSQILIGDKFWDVFSRQQE